MPSVMTQYTTLGPPYAVPETCRSFNLQFSLDPPGGRPTASLATSTSMEMRITVTAKLCRTLPSQVRATSAPLGREYRVGATL